MAAIFTQNPRDFYLVENTVEYSCIDGFYLSGNAVARCADNQKWVTGAMVCQSMYSLKRFLVLLVLEQVVSKKTYSNRHQ